MNLNIILITFFNVIINIQFYLSIIINNNSPFIFLNDNTKLNNL